MKGLTENIVYSSVASLKKYKIEYQKIVKKIFSIDFLINDKLIININGPSHYIITDYSQLNQKTLQKTKILESFGYRVVNFNLLNFTNTFKNSSDRKYIRTHFDKIISDNLSDI